MTTAAKFFSLTCLALLSSGNHSVTSGSNGHYYTRTLQIETTAEGDVSFLVEASCEVKYHYLFDSIRYSLEDVRVKLFRYDLGYNSVKILFEHKEKSAFNTQYVESQLPTWDGTYVVSSSVVLPSARVKRVGDGLYYILCSKAFITCFK